MNCNICAQPLSNIQIKRGNISCSIFCRGKSTAFKIQGNKNHWKGGKFCIDCGIERGRYDAKRCKPCNGLIKRGKNHWNYKGNPSFERQRLMGQREYKLWRNTIFKRDNYTCKICLVRGGNLEADHIKPWSLFPALRYTIDNGRTLCVTCHRTTKTYGFRVNFA